MNPLKGVGGLLLLFGAMTGILSGVMKLPPQISATVSGATTIGVFLLTQN